MVDPDAMTSRRESFDHSAVEYRVQPGGRANGDHVVTAHLGGQEVGHLDWSPHRGHVEMVKVHPSVRGVGIAEGLWQHAKLGAQKNGLVEPIHSDVQLPAGRAWAQGMVAKSGPKNIRRKPLSKTAGEGQDTLF